MSLVTLTIQYSELSTLTVIPCIVSHCPSLEHLDIAVPIAADMASRQSLMALCQALWLPEAEHRPPPIH
jgi:hypothetical protein